MTRTTLKIDGMTCGHCVAAVTKALQAVEGVHTANVDLPTGRATVEYDETQAKVTELVSAVIDEGYTAEESE